MKLTSLLLIVAAVHLSAATRSQTLSLSIRNQPLSEVFEKISNQTDLVVVYNERFVDPDTRVSFSVKEASLTKTLELLLNPLSLTYHITENTIVVTKQRKAQQARLIPQVAALQQRTISGRVTDEQGSSLEGVTVRVKETGTIATTTDADGRYRLALRGEGNALIYTIVGFEAAEAAVGNLSVINISLKAAISGLDEVVVMGYGTSRRRDLVGSVASVSGETLKDIPVTSAADAMVGRMPGVRVARSDGDPEAPIKITIRGGGSITQDNSPLFLVDGFPVDDINDISPIDIVSIDVLKDASSTAIYGARGANGVVIVTTRGGQEGAGRVRYNMYYGQKQITDYYDVLDAYEYVAWQYTRMGGSAASFAPRFGDFRDIDLYKQVTGTNWQEAIFGRAGNSLSNNISFSGGNKVSKYNISLLRSDENEILLGSGFDRTNLTTKTNHQLNNWLSIDLNARLSDRTNHGAGTSTNWNHAVQYRPVNGLFDFVDLENDEDNLDDEDLLSNINLRDPVVLNKDTYRLRKSLSVNINGALNVKLPVEGLTYRLEFGKEFSKSETDQFYGLNTSTARANGEQPTASITKVNGDAYRVANIATYSKRNIWPGSNVNVMMGQEINYAKDKSILSSVKFLPKYIDAVSAINMMQLGTANPIVTSDNPDETVSSYFGRVNYDYKAKYLVSLSIRADGSSKFAPENRWGYFPAAGLAWRISDEAFMKGSRSFINDLKLRASYGSSGNNRISDNAWRKTFSVTTSSLFMEGNEDTYTPYLIPNSFLPNPLLKWESTLTRNLGLDFVILKSRINGTVEVYKNTTKDLLIRATIPSSTGYTTQFQNIGQTSNKGVEFSVNADVVKNKNFRLVAGFNIGFNRYHIDKLGETKNWIESTGILSTVGPGGDYFIEEGGSVGLMYGYQLDGNGIYSFDDFNYENGIYTLKEGVVDDRAMAGISNFAPGALKLADQNGDLIIDNDDKIVIGNANPKHTGGFNLNAQYKGFDFSVFFNWVYGNDVYNANKMALTLSGQSAANSYGNIFNVMNSANRFSYFDMETGLRVTEPAALAELNKNAKYWSPVYNRALFYSWHVEDGSFLRLNNLVIGYSLPKTLLSRVRIADLRVYVTGYNLWIWTNYTGYDPEVDSRRTTPLTPGVDYNAYPRARSYNVGLNLTF